MEVVAVAMMLSRFQNNKNAASNSATTYTEDDMEMLRTEIRNLSKERESLRALLLARDKEMLRVLKELKRTKNFVRKLQSDADQQGESERDNGDNADKEETEAEPLEKETGSVRDETPLATPDDSAAPQVEEKEEEQNEVTPDVNRKDLKPADLVELEKSMDNDSFDLDFLHNSDDEEDEEEYAKEDVLEEENGSKDKLTTEGSATSDPTVSTGLDNVTDSSDPDEIRKRAARMLVWANSATNRNDAKKEVPRTISLDENTAFSGYSANSNDTSKRLYKNFPNDSPQINKKKSGPLSGIRQFVQEQIVGGPDSREDTYLDSDSEDDSYYSDECSRQSR